MAGGGLFEKFLGYDVGMGAVRRHARRPARSREAGI